MRIKIWSYAANMGDGSVGVYLFASEEEARAASKKDSDKYGENYCDDVSWHELEIDSSGKIVKV